MIDEIGDELAGRVNKSIESASFSTPEKVSAVLPPDAVYVAHSNAYPVESTLPGLRHYLQPEVDELEQEISGMVAEHKSQPFARLRRWHDDSEATLLVATTHDLTLYSKDGPLWSRPLTEIVRLDYCVPSHSNVKTDTRRVYTARDGSGVVTGKQFPALLPEGSRAMTLGGLPNGENKYFQGWDTIFEPYGTKLYSPDNATTANKLFRLFPLLVVALIIVSIFLT